MHKDIIIHTSDDAGYNRGLSIRNYIENKHEQGIRPSINQIALFVVFFLKLDEGLHYADVAEIVSDLGFSLERDDSKTISELLVII